MKSMGFWVLLFAFQFISWSEARANCADEEWEVNTEVICGCLFADKTWDKTSRELELEPFRKVFKMEKDAEAYANQIRIAIWTGVQAGFVADSLAACKQACEKDFPGKKTEIAQCLNATNSTLPGVFLRRYSPPKTYLCQELEWESEEVFVSDSLEFPTLLEY